ncbi:response regulator transcription factor [Chryseolinea sp. H1M3-3]|uniref:response regulator n=1 Tax=Chryseolinea sp. H1M3-3 TaxID=3034144 RepID=UPI0023EB2AD8|nr:response regulator transcription factor [Chryseolinea sp. H1M3-3]
MTKLNFLLVEDEALIREGLRSLLEKENFIKEIREASNAGEFKEQLKNEIDFVLMDFRLADTNGLSLLALLKKESQQPKVIMLTGLEGTELLMNLLKAGVNGIVYKLDGYKEILNTINGVLEKGSYFSPKILNLIQTNAHRWDQVPPVVLSLPERDLLKAIASGYTTKEIASLLKMSDSTAETYRIRLIKKMGVLNTAGLIAYAYRNGIL